MPRHTLQEVSQDTLALEEFLKTVPSGERLSYGEIELATKVSMTVIGKQRLRTAAKRAKRVYATIRGFGIELSSGRNSGSISRTGLVRLDSMARRQEKLNVALLTQHAGDMPDLDRHQISTVATMFAQVRVLADGHKRMMSIARRNRPKALPPLQAKEVLAN